MFFPPFHVASPTCFLDLILNNTLRMLSLSSLSKTLLSISVPCLDFYSINYNLQVFLFVFVCLLVYLCFCLHGLRLGLSHSLLYLVAQNGSRLLNICWLNEWGNEWPPNLELSRWGREREGKGVGGYVVWQHQMSQRPWCPCLHNFICSILVFLKQQQNKINKQNEWERA